MKKVRITGYKTDVTVILTWENLLTEDCPDLKLEKGRDLGIFFRNNKDRYKFESLVYYDRPYHPSEILEALTTKNPLINKLVSAFSLQLTI